MIVQGDCIEVMAGMEPESVDAIVTGLDVERLARAFVSAGMLQHQWKDASGPPWPSVSPREWARIVAIEYDSLSERGL